MKAGFVKLRMPLVLGSRSPRRLELLAAVGLEVIERPADVDESPIASETPSGYVERVTRSKLDAVRAATQSELPESLGILVADTTVTIDGDILGKPRDGEEAKAMLQRLAGRTHEVLTCYGLTRLGPDAPISAAPGLLRTVTTRVSMRECSPRDIERYVASEEPFGKAGGYAIQGLGAQLVQRIEGSYTGVVGLPLCEVLLDLAHLGVVEPLG